MFYLVLCFDVFKRVFMLSVSLVQFIYSRLKWIIPSCFDSTCRLNCMGFCVLNKQSSYKHCFIFILVWDFIFCFVSSSACCLLICVFSYSMIVVEYSHLSQCSTKWFESEHVLFPKLLQSLLRQIFFLHLRVDRVRACAVSKTLAIFVTTIFFFHG